MRWPHGGPSAIKVSGCMHNEGGLTRSFDTIGMRHKFVHVVKLCVCMLTTTSILVIIILGRAETNMKFWV